MMAATALAEARSTTIGDLRRIAFASLTDMYDRESDLFVFRVRRAGSSIVREGTSARYTAISLIGLAGERAEVVERVLHGSTVRKTAERLVGRLELARNLGDLALIAWAGAAAGCATDRVWARIVELGPDRSTFPTVEIAWTLSALAADPAAPAVLRERMCGRLLNACSAQSGLFPHTIGRDHAAVRGHVSCFADLVYPILALSQHGMTANDGDAISCAARAAEVLCRLQGPAGQWWWHYDYRTGQVIERYPVYAVHQDAMAPMALFAAAKAARVNVDAAVAKGLRWLWSSPELGGASLVDTDAGVIWRKVARREPAKLSRYVQAAASRISPALRAPSFFPPGAIDYEDRPYHLGWLLYAWPPVRAERWSGESDAS